MGQDFNNDQNNFNNQPKDNQNFNQGTGVNPQPVNQMNNGFPQQPVEQPVQPQSIPQQPVMQEPISQPVNTFAGNVGNESLNSKPPKKTNLGLIIGIVVTVVIVAVVILFLLNGKNNNTGNGIIGGNGSSQSITSKDIESYALENDTIWINNSLGVTYNIPKKISQSIANGSSSFSYLHGSSFQYYNGYKIYVDKSLEGHTDLESLASDIISEKLSDKYKLVYNFGSSFLKEFNNKATNKVKIGNYDTIYFESEELDANSVFGNELKIKIVGYSFKYKEEYISVYGELLVEEDNQMDSLKQMLQFIINSIKPYDGKSLQELNGNAKNYYDDGYTNYFKDVTDVKFTINYLSPHTHNGVLRNDDTVIFPNKEWFTWDGTTNNILSQLLTHQFATLYIKWYKTAYNSETKSYETLYDIFDQKTEHVNGTDFYKYTLKVYYNTKKTAGKVLVVYFFVVDNQPYLFQYSLDSSIYKQKTLGEMTSEEQEVIIKQTEEVAYNYLLTFRHLNNGEDYMPYVTLFN